jgi:hypothetical protein
MLGYGYFDEFSENNQTNRRGITATRARIRAVTYTQERKGKHVRGTNLSTLSDKQTAWMLKHARNVGSISGYSISL